MTRFAAPIADQIWDMKYRFKGFDGTPVDATVEDTWNRIAGALAQAEKPEVREYWHHEFYKALEDFKFLPAGRITSGAGTGRNVTMMNCYVLGTIPDSMPGIFGAVTDAALTMQQGGGIGHDFSTIRPRGAEVKGVGADASGPLSFMDVWDSMCRTVMSAGSRRGAMMATMRCDHPDIESFIEAKRDPLKLRMFNLSVLVTDAFMQAVKDDTGFDLVHSAPPPGESEMIDGKWLYRTVRARDLWDKIMRSTYGYAEPGVIFIDRINQMNPLRYLETIAATNPCVPAGTPILTRRGWWPIEDTIGSDVEVWNGREWSHVVPKVTGHNQRLVTVKLSDGRELTCTPSHRFVSEKGDRIDAKDLTTGTKLIRCDWPLVHGHIAYERAYEQGFFSGDGSFKSGKSPKSAYIMLYGEKKHLEDEFASPLSRGEYVISGGYDGTNTDETKVYLRYGADEFLPKNFVPGAEWNVESRLRWLEGLVDSDGCAVRSYNSVLVQISAKDRQFLYDTMLMLNTLGVSANLSAMKDCWRLGISANNVARLQQLGFQPKRLDISDNNPQRECARFTRVTEIVEHDEIADVVYCFTEDKRHMGCFNGVLTGQCGEQPLPPYGACLLGSINLTRFVKNPFENGAKIDTMALKQIVHVAVRMMDNVIDVTNFPLPQQAEEARNKRRIGLGITGLADMLLMLGVTYGSDKAVKVTERISRTIAYHAYLASAELAKEKGAFPLFDAKEYLNHPYVQQFFDHDDGEPDTLKTAIATHGLRNSHLTSIAPTGTISLYAGNVSSGIEPVFAYHYTRKVLQPDGSKTEERVEDYALNLFYQLDQERRGAELPDYFVSTQTLEPAAHVRMQAAAQKWVDSSISKTINCPEDISFEDFKAVYELAYDLGCKGCTTYRPNDVTGSVLSVDKPAEKKDERPVMRDDGGHAVEVESRPGVVSEPASEDDPRPGAETWADTHARLTSEPAPVLASRADALHGQTYKLRWPGTDHALYVTINDDEQGRPYEVFLNTKNPEHYAWMMALTRMISAVFRRGGDTSFVAEELKAVFDPRGGAWVKGKYVPSMIAAIGDIIQNHVAKPNDWQHVTDAAMQAARDATGVTEAMLKVGKPCPKCSSYNTKNESGCFQCLDCGDSKCG